MIAVNQKRLDTIVSLDTALKGGCIYEHHIDYAPHTLTLASSVVHQRKLLSMLALVFGVSRISWCALLAYWDRR